MLRRRFQSQAENRASVVNTHAVTSIECIVEETVCISRVGSFHLFVGVSRCKDKYIEFGSSLSRVFSVRVNHTPGRWDSDIREFPAIRCHDLEMHGRTVCKQHGEYQLGSKNQRFSAVFLEKV